MGSDSTAAAPAPAATGAAGSWTMEWDKDSKKPFYHNSATKESLWEHPLASLKKSPSPPPKPKQKIREPDQWSKIDDGKGKGKKVWYNCVTEARQYEMPDCRVKYKP